MKIRILLAVSFVVGLVVLTGCDSSKPKAVGTPEHLTIGTYSGDLSALLWIAKDRGYFSEHGLDVQFKIRESGLMSLRDLVAREVDLATVSEFVFVSDIFKQPDLRVLSVVAQNNSVKLVARKDHGITQMSDLNNKRIGLVRDSMAGYYLDRLLMLHQIPGQDVQIVDMPPSEEVKAISQGDIDAAVVWEPFATQMQKELGTNGVS